MRKVKRERKK